MPRTKQPKKIKKPKENVSDSSIASTSKTYKSSAQLLKEIDHEKELALKSFDAEVQKKLKTFDMDSKVTLMKNKHNFNNIKISDWINMFKDNITNKELSSSLLSNIHMAVSDPTFALSTLPSMIGSAGPKSTCSTESTISSFASGSMRPPSSASSSSKYVKRVPGKVQSSLRRSRSAARVPYGIDGSGMKRRSLSQPSSLKKAPFLSAAYKTPIITPKVNPNTATTVLRMAKSGETIFSTSGSPVLANGGYTSNSKPHAVIPLRDGRMLAILANKGSLDDERLAISPDTRKNLMLLKENLDKIVG